MLREIWCIAPPARGQGELLFLQKKIRFISPISVVFDPFILLGNTYLSEKEIKKKFNELGNLSISGDYYFRGTNLCLDFSLIGVERFLDFFTEDSYLGEKGSFIIATDLSSDKISHLEERLVLENPLVFHTFSLQKWTINFKEREWIEWEKEVFFHKKRNS